MMRVHYPKLRNIVHIIYLPLNVFIASKGSNLYILLDMIQITKSANHLKSTESGFASKLHKTLIAKVNTQEAVAPSRYVCFVVI